MLLRTPNFQIDEFYLDLQKDGREITLLSYEELDERPFPGLRPFKTSEHQLFYGRDGQADRLIERLHKYRFLAVLGSSGTGKSSLVRAGLLPHLFSGYLENAGYNWSIAISRPGKDPIKNLAVALASVKCGSFEYDKISKELEVIEPVLRRNPYGILDIEKIINEQNHKGPATNLMVIVDQFEELFRYKNENKETENSEDSAHFINLLLNATIVQKGTVYVVITMRSEFLGECVQFRGLPEAINKGQFLVPRLNRFEIKEVITGPLDLTNKDISSVLVNQIIDEMGDNMDQLPLLQHALMRTYDAWKEDKESNLIDTHHYELSGKMEMALANHADQKFSELSDNKEGNRLSKKQHIAKIIFQCLTDKTSDDRGIRRPTVLSDIYDIAREIGGSEEEVNSVINHFREKETSFLMPPINTKLHPDLTVDIAHESLMRNWKLLEEWIKEEIKASRIYKSLDERRGFKELGKYDWIKGGLLEDMLEWKETYHINSTWAARYHIKGLSKEEHEREFAKNMSFLEASRVVDLKQKKTAIENEKKEIRRKQRERFQTGFLLAISAALIIAIGLIFWAFSLRKDAIEARNDYQELARKQEQIASDANKNADFAVREQTRADSIADIEKELRIAADSNSRIIQRALTDRDKALQEKEEEIRRAMKAERKARIARNRADSAASVAITRLDSLQEEKKYSAFLQNFINTENWIKSISETHRKYITDTLYALYKSDSSQASTIKESFEMASEANNVQNENFILALFLAKEAKSLNNNIVTAEVLANLLKNKIVYKTKFRVNGDVKALGFVGEHNKFIVGTTEGFYEFDLLGKDSTLLFKLGYSKIPLAISLSGRHFAIYDEIKNKISVTNRNGNTISNFKTKFSFLYSQDVKAIFSSDGQQILINDQPYVAHLYNLDGKLQQEFREDEYFLITEFSFSGDGDHIITNNLLGTVSVWDIDGQRVFGAGNNNMAINSSLPQYPNIRNQKSGQRADPSLSMPNMIHLSPIDGKQFSFDGKYCLDFNDSVNFTDIKIQNTNNLQSKIFPWHNGDIEIAAFSHDNTQIITGDDDEVYIWEPDGPLLSESQLTFDGGVFDKAPIYSYLISNATEYSTGKDRSKAVYFYEKALTLEPNHSEEWRKLGDIQYEINQYEEAIKCYIQALENAPENYRIWNNLGNAYYSSGDYSEAIKCYENTLKSDSLDKVVWANLGNAYQESTRYQDAKEAFETAVNIDSSYDEAWSDLGLAHTNLEDYEAAEKCFQKAVELAPNEKVYLTNLGSSYGWSENYIEAFKYLKKAAEIDSMNTICLNNLGFFFNRVGLYDSAYLLFNKVISLDSKYANSRAHRGYIYLKKGEFKNAFEDLSKAEELNPTYNKTYFYWSCYYAAQNNQKEAINYLNIAIEKGFAEKRYVKWIEKEECLESVRNTPEFLAILKRLKK